MTRADAERLEARLRPYINRGFGQLQAARAAGVDSHTVGIVWARLCGARWEAETCRVRHYDRDRPEHARMAVNALRQARHVLTRALVERDARVFAVKRRAVDRAREAANA